MTAKHIVPLIRTESGSVELNAPKPASMHLVKGQTVNLKRSTMGARKGTYQPLGITQRRYEGMGE